jgi:hypothetical protein
MSYFEVIDGKIVRELPEDQVTPELVDGTLVYVFRPTTPVLQHLHGFVEGVCECGMTEADYLAEVPDIPYTTVTRID